MRKFLVLILSLSFSIFQSCKNEIRTFTANEKAIRVERGILFSIALPEEHEKGQTWSVVSTHNTTSFSYLKSNYRGKTAGITDFIFESKKSGIDTLQFNLTAYGEVIQHHKVVVNVH